MKFRYLAVLPLLALPISSANAGTIRSHSGVLAQVADRAVSAFQCLVSALERQGYPIRFMGGFARSGHMHHSLHYSGLALDVNQLSRGVTRPRMPSDEIGLAHGCGLTSGAQWANNDSGHFQLGGFQHVRLHYAHTHHFRHRTVLLLQKQVDGLQRAATSHSTVHR